MRARWLTLLLPLALLSPERAVYAAPAGAETLGITRYRALLIGVDDYADGTIRDLKTPHADVTALAEVLSKQYSFDEVSTLTGRSATRAGILKALNELRKRAGPNDAVLVYYAGHGTRDTSLEQGYWLPADAERGGHWTYISNADVRDMLRGMDARHVLLISDSCFAGSLFGTKDMGTATVASDLRAASRLARDKSRWVITSGGDEPVMDGHIGSEHSVFAYFLLKQLREAEGPYLNPGAFMDDLQKLVINNAPQKPEAAPLRDAGDEGGQMVLIPARRAPEVTACTASAAAAVRCAEAAKEWTSTDVVRLRELQGAVARDFIAGFVTRYQGSGATEVDEARAWLNAYIEVEPPPPPRRPSSGNLSGRVIDAHGYRMISIPGGTFTMGCTPGAGECYDWEKPAHRVTISGFAMGATEVTQGLWNSVMGSNPSHFSSCGDACPVEKVSWLDSVAFANELSLKEGLEECYRISGETVTWPKGLACRGYRLPTESEWEYAARAGEDTLYAGSNDAGSVAWYSSNSGSKTHRVGGKSANGRGLYDMTGNVWEWTWDWYQKNYQSSSSVDPVGPQSGSVRVVRGGGWLYTSRFVRVASRSYSAPSNRRNYVGLRLSKSIP